MQEKVNTREIILDILLAVTRDKQFSHIVLNDVLMKYEYLDKRDRSFIQKVSIGTLENMLFLDYVLNQFSSVKVNKMKPVIRCILRLSVYQMFFLDSVPDSATVNEAVNLAGKRGFKNLKGFVNGVLRNISRNKNEIKFPDKKDFASLMECKYSLPSWITELWLKQYDKETIEKIAESFLAQKKTCIRLNTKVLKDEKARTAFFDSMKEQEITLTEIPEIPYSYFMEGFDSLTGIPEFEEGAFFIQDLSSMKMIAALDPKPEEMGLDICAAPGGKSIHAALLMQDKGEIISRDLTSYKVELIEDNMDRLGLESIKPECHDATVLDESLRNSRDFVIADLPCSGLGVLGRKPDIKYHASLEQVKELAALQQQILDVACTYVKENGRLMFSTCTINEIENEKNAESFLKKHPEFTKVREEQILPCEGSQDGFYYCLFARKGER